LGVFIGLAGGYLYFNSQIKGLSFEFDQMSADYDTKDLTLTNILSEIGGLNEDYEQLQVDHEQLQAILSDLEAEKLDIESYSQEIENAYNELLEDYELLVASLPLSPQQLSGTIIEREYEWSFNGIQYDLSLSLPETQYDYYKNLERIHDNDYSVYVTHPYDDEFINTIIRKFNIIALEENLTEEEKINLVISFVQSLPYTVDNVTTNFDEYPRYPLETLVDNGGDCEDSSILTASLLKSMNYEVILIDFPGHVAVGVNIDTYGSYWLYEDEEYFYIETTGQGWKIGDLPDEYLETTAYMYPLNPIPMCVQNWTAQWNGRNKMDVTVSVSNLGSAIAENIRVVSSFDAGEDYIWNREESDLFNLNIGKSVTITLTLDVPKNKNTRLIVYILNSEGFAVDKSYSEWFDT